jgi:amidase
LTQLAAGQFTSVDLTQAYLDRIDEVNLKGPELRAVIAVSPVALQAAKQYDDERKNGKSRGILHGIPCAPLPVPQCPSETTCSILVKDNIDTQAADGMNTTAGSYALVGTTVAGDAEIVKRLKDAGAIILGKCNLSQWAFWRADDGIPSGWSSVGGQATNPYVCRNPSLTPLGAHLVTRSTRRGTLRAARVAQASPPPSASLPLPCAYPHTQLSQRPALTVSAAAVTPAVFHPSRLF